MAGSREIQMGCPECRNGRYVLQIFGNGVYWQILKRKKKQAIYDD